MFLVSSFIDSRTILLIAIWLTTGEEVKNVCTCVRTCGHTRERERERPGRSGFKSTVNCIAIKELSLSLVASTALESPTFPITIF